jgi:hypothetical protein
VDGTVSGSCPIISFGIRDFEPFGFTGVIRESVKVFLEKLNH